MTTVALPFIMRVIGETKKLLSIWWKYSTVISVGCNSICYSSYNHKYEHLEIKLLNFVTCKSTQSRESILKKDKSSDSLHVSTDVISMDGQSPLKMALGDVQDAGHFSVAQYLIKRGSGNYDDKVKLLYGACWRGDLNVVKELIKQHKVDPRGIY